MLKKGDRGPEVKTLQGQLAEFAHDPGKLDGILGPKTLAAVNSFEGVQGLPLSGGEILPATLALLAELAGAPAPTNSSAVLQLVDGILVAPPGSPYVVFQAPTPEHGQRTKEIDHLILHHTACKASERPLKDLPRLLDLAGYSQADAARLTAELGGGPIPSIVALALQGQAEPTRKSSWDFGIGDGPRDYLEGKLPLVQCNPDMRKRYTWHATWINKQSLGYEVEYYGYLSEHAGRYYFDGDGPGGAEPRDVTARLPGGVETFQGKLCERLHSLTRQAIHDLSRLLCREFGIPVSGVKGHRDIDPNRRIDPHPAYSVEEVRGAVAA